jgi:hypothetical protein
MLISAIYDLRLANGFIDLKIRWDERIELCFSKIEPFVKRNIIFGKIVFIVQERL